MAMQEVDPYKPPRTEEADRQDGILIGSPAFRWQLWDAIWSSATTIGIFAVFLPRFTNSIWWTIFVPIVVIQMTSWWIEKRKAQPVLQALEATPSEPAGKLILGAGAFRGRTGEGRGKSFWGPVYLTGEELIIGKGQFAEHVGLAEMKRVSRWGDGLHFHLRNGKKVSVYLLNGKEWRRRIKAALLAMEEKVPPGVAAVGEPRGLQ